MPCRSALVDEPCSRLQFLTHVGHAAQGWCRKFAGASVLSMTSVENDNFGCCTHSVSQTIFLKKMHSFLLQSVSTAADTKQVAIATERGHAGIRRPCVYYSCQTTFLKKVHSFALQKAPTAAHRPWRNCRQSPAPKPSAGMLVRSLPSKDQICEHTAFHTLSMLAQPCTLQGARRFWSRQTPAERPWRVCLTSRTRASAPLPTLTPGNGCTLLQSHGMVTDVQDASALCACERRSKFNELMLLTTS